MKSKTLVSLVLSGTAMLSTTANATTAVPYSVGFAASGGAVPAGFAMLLWAPLLALVFGGLLLLVVLVARQPREGMKSAPATKMVQSPDPGESQYEMQKAA